MVNEASVRSGSGGGIVLQSRYEIDPQAPLPDLDMPQAKAFECLDKRGAGRLLYALICRADLPVRVGAMRALKGVQSSGLLQIVEYGVVDWPLSKRRTMAVVYERPMGGRVQPKPGVRFDPIPEIQFNKKVIRPLLLALQEMSGHGVTHRSIRLDNIYWFDANRERIVLGDYVTSPPGYDNPPAYEPLEMAMALPYGRGQGHIKDDLYALGMLAISLICGRDITQGWSDEDVIKGKLSQSTYACFVADNRVPLNLLELMRGLLCDDLRDRWDIEAVDLWLNGRRTSPIQPKPAKRAQRAFRFEGADYYTARELACALAMNWEQAIQPIQDGRLEVWLRRGLGDNDHADTVAHAIRMSQALQGDLRQISDMTIARCLILLHPGAPLRYRDIRVTLDGFGIALAVASMQKKPLRPYMEILARDLPKHWIDAQGAYSTEMSHFEGQFKDLMANLTTQMLGWGIERCFYELNEHLHCQSPLVESEYVTDIRDLLPALDRVAARSDLQTRPMDRHLAAFIGVKWRRETQVQLRTLNEPGIERSVLGMVSLLAVLQWRLGPPVLHSLCRWVEAYLGPIIKGYHSRERRRTLENDIQALVQRGYLPELYNTLDNQKERDQDNAEFALFREEYSNIDSRIHAIEQGILIRDSRAEEQGQKASAVLSVTVAVLTVIGLLFLGMW